MRRSNETKKAPKKESKKDTRKSAPIIKSAALQLTKSIGSGAQGQVYLAKWQQSRENSNTNVKKPAIDVVVKTMIVSTDNQARAFNKEIHVLCALSHLNLMRLFGVVKDTQKPNEQWLVMPFMAAGSLDSFIEKTDSALLGWPGRLSLSQDLIAGLRYLHKNKVLHRDIKCANVLLDKSIANVNSNNNRPGGYIAKFTDFGIARVGTESLTQTFVSGGAIGTRHYMAPELRPWLPSKKNLPPSTPVPYSEGSDIYALGAVFWELARWRLLVWDGDNFSGKFEFPLPLSVPPLYRQWIKACLAREAEQRPRSQQLYRVMHNPDQTQKLLNQAALSAPNRALLAAANANNNPLASLATAMDWTFLWTTPMQPTDYKKTLSSIKSRDLLRRSTQRTVSFVTQPKKRPSKSVQVQGLENIQAALITYQSKGQTTQHYQHIIATISKLIANPSYVNGMNRYCYDLVVAQVLSVAHIAYAHSGEQQTAFEKNVLHSFMPHHWSRLNAVQQVRLAQGLACAWLAQNHRREDDSNQTAALNTALSWLSRARALWQSLTPKQQQEYRPLGDQGRYLAHAFSVHCQQQWLRQTPALSHHAAYYAAEQLLESVSAFYAAFTNIEITEQQQSDWQKKIATPVMNAVFEPIQQRIKQQLDQAIQPPLQLDRLLNVMPTVLRLQRRCAKFGMNPAQQQTLFALWPTVIDRLLKQAKTKGKPHYQRTVNRLIEPLVTAFMQWGQWQWIAALGHSVSATGTSIGFDGIHYEATLKQRWQQAHNNKANNSNKTTATRDNDQTTTDPLAEHFGEFAFGPKQQAHPSHRPVATPHRATSATHNATTATIDEKAEDARTIETIAIKAEKTEASPQLSAITTTSSPNKPRQRRCDFYQTVGAKAYTNDRLERLTQRLSCLMPLLGAPPCAVALLARGDFAGQRALPFSALKLAILVETAEHRSHPWLQRYVQLLQTITRIIDPAWHWVSLQANTEGHLQPDGHHIDADSLTHTSMKSPLLIQTPEQLAQWSIAQLSTESNHPWLAQSMLYAHLIAGVARGKTRPQQLLERFVSTLNTVLDPRTEYDQEGHPKPQKLIRQDMAQTLLTLNARTYKKVLRQQRNSELVDLNSGLVAPLKRYLLTVGLHVGLVGHFFNQFDRLFSRLEIERTFCRQWADVLKNLWSHVQSLCVEQQHKGNTGQWLIQPTAEIERLQDVLRIVLSAQTPAAWQDTPQWLASQKVTEEHCRGLAALTTFTKHKNQSSQPLLTLTYHRTIYLKLNHSARQRYEKTLKDYQQQGVLAVPELLSIFPTVPLPDGSRTALTQRNHSWQQTLLHLTEDLPKKLPRRGAIIEWVYQDSNDLKKPYQTIKLCLKLNYVKKLLNAKGVPFTQQTTDNEIDDGRRTVHVLRSQDKKQPLAFVKVYPELPGRQLAIDALTYRLTGSGVQATLAKVTPVVKGKLQSDNSFTVMLSKPAGITVQDYLRQQLHQFRHQQHKKSPSLPSKPPSIPSLENLTLDPYHFTLKVLATYLIAYEDDKKDNVCLAPLPVTQKHSEDKTLDKNNTRWQLISIDTDHAFVDAMKQVNDQTLVNIKTVTFCFDQMRQPLDPQAIADFLHLDPLRLLKAWLKECHALDKAYSGVVQRHNNKLTRTGGIFSVKEMTRLGSLKRSWLSSPIFSFVPIAFEPGLIARLYQRWQRLRRLLSATTADSLSDHQDNKQIATTPMVLLQQLTPRLAQAYDNSQQAYQTVAERFDHLPMDYVVKEKGEQITQHTTTTQVNMTPTLIDGVKDFKKALLEGKVFSAGHGVNELNDVHARYRSLQDMRQIFSNGVSLSQDDQQVYLSSLVRIANDMPEEVEESPSANQPLTARVSLYDFIKERALNSLRFAKNQDQEALRNWQIKLLTALVGTAFQHLNLRGWIGLNDTLLVQLLASSPGLQYLDIRDCPNLTWQVNARQKRTRSTWALISALCPVLHTLKVSGVPKLKTKRGTLNTKAVEFPALAQLVITNSPLTIYQLRAPQLKQLHLIKALQLNRLDLSGQPLIAVKLIDCPTLKDHGVIHDRQGQYLRRVRIKECARLVYRDYYHQYPGLLGQSSLLRSEKQLKALVKTIKTTEQQLRDSDKALLPLYALIQQCLVYVGSAWQQLLLPVIERLSKALKDKWDRASAAEALGRVWDQLSEATQARVIERLSEALKDKGRYVRARAAEALGRVAEHASGAIPARVIERLSEALRDENWYVRARAAEALGRVAEHASDSTQAQVIKRLSEALRDENWHVRARAAVTLSPVWDQLSEATQARAIRRLSTVLKVKNHEAGLIAAEALVRAAEHGSEFIQVRVIERLSEALKSKVSNVQVKAVEALGRVVEHASDSTQERVFEHLSEALKSKVSNVQVKAAEALGRVAKHGSDLTQAQVIERLSEVLKGDNNNYVLVSAAEVLVRVAEHGSELIQVRVIERLSQALKHWDSAVLVRAAEGLVRVWDQLGDLTQAWVIERLSTALTDTDSDVRERAAEALLWLWDQLSDSTQAWVIDRLSEVLKGDNNYVRANAVQALGWVAGHVSDSTQVRVIKRLSKVLKDKFYYISLWAAAALLPVWDQLSDSIQARVIERLSEALKDKHKYNRARVAELLVRVWDQLSDPTQVRVIERLSETLKGDNKVLRESTAEALVRVIEKVGDSTQAWVIERLSEALKDQDSNVRANAVEVLGRVAEHGSELIQARVIEHLSKALKDKNQVVCASAAEALVRVAEYGSDSTQAQVIRRLVEALFDWNSNVRASAAKALVRVAEHGSDSIQAWVIERLSEALTDKGSDVRAKAAEVLGKLFEQICSYEKQFERLLSREKKRIARQSKKQRKPVQSKATNTQYDVASESDDPLNTEDDQSLLIPSNLDQDNNSVHYDDKHIDRLLKSKFSQEKHGVNLMLTVNNLTALTDQLAIALGQTSSPLVSVHHCSIIPLHFNLQWSLMIVVPSQLNKEQQQAAIIYHNPNGQAIDEALQKVIAQLQCHLIDSQLEQQLHQLHHNDSGPCVVQSAVRLLQWLHQNKRPIIKQYVIQNVLRPIANKNGQTLRREQASWLKMMTPVGNRTTADFDYLINPIAPVLRARITRPELLKAGLYLLWVVKQVSPLLYNYRHTNLIRANFGKILFFAHRQRIKNNPEIRNTLRTVFKF